MSVAWGCIQVKVRVQELLERAAYGDVIDIDAEMPIPDHDGDDEVFPQPVRVRVKVSPTGTGVLVQGRVTGVAKQICSRCLQMYALPLDIPVTVEYRLESEMPRPYHEFEDEEEWFPVEGEFIDLLEPIRQHLLVALPMKPLCDEECPGLEGTVPEEEAAEDPRMQALAELRKKIEDEEKGG